MKKFLFYSFFIILIAAVVGIGVLNWSKLQAKAQIVLPQIVPASLNADGTPQITDQQLIDAGFTNVRRLQVQASRFNAPVVYYSTGQSASWTNDKGVMESSNIVAVSVKAIADKTWLYNGGSPESRTYAGLSQVRDSKAGWYFVVTGPDAVKVAKLVSLIKASY